MLRHKNGRHEIAQISAPLTLHPQSSQIDAAHQCVASWLSSNRSFLSSSLSLVFQLGKTIAAPLCPKSFPSHDLVHSHDPVSSCGLHEGVVPKSCRLPADTQTYVTEVFLELLSSRCSCSSSESKSRRRRKKHSETPRPLIFFFFVHVCDLLLKSAH